jgi:sporulation protein YlmC with PRC-barrel domain
VEGTAVYNRAGERLGEVYNFMVDKYSGRVAYAVMSFGGRPGASHIPAGVALPISE